MKQKLEGSQKRGCCFVFWNYKKGEGLRRNGEEVSAGFLG